MNKTLLLTLSAIMLCIGNYLNATGNITEIVNNTESDITIQINESGKKISIVQNFLLSNETEIQPPNQVYPMSVTLPAKTRGTFSNLSFPLAHICNSTTDPHIVIAFWGKEKKYQVRGSRSGTKILLRQSGDLIDIRPINIRLPEIHLPSGLIMRTNLGSTLYLTDEKINQGSTYSIELQANGAEITLKIKRNNQQTHVSRKQITRPIACIKHFNNTKTPIQAIVNFDQIVTQEFFNKFLNTIKNDEFFKRVSKMKIEDKGSRLLIFDLYTNINKEEFQKKLDQINKLTI